MLWHATGSRHLDLRLAAVILPPELFVHVHVGYWYPHKVMFTSIINIMRHILCDIAGMEFPFQKFNLNLI